MVGYRNVLAAVGTGVEAGWVLSRARAVAEARKAKLSMLHVIRRRFGKEAQPVALEAALEQPDLDLDQATFQALIALRDTLDGQHVTSLVGAGHPARMILRTARERGVDFLVMGSHGRHGVAGYLGSTTDHVAHGAECDVLVVKAQQAEGRVPPAGYSRFLVPVDFSGDSLRIVEHARMWAEHYGAQITLLHIEERFPTDRSNDFITPEDQDPAEDLRSRAEAALVELARVAGLSSAGLEFQFNSGAAKHAIVEYAAQLGADLVVMGSHGLHGPGVLLGSNTDGVLHRAPCDVLLVRVRS